MIRCGRLVVRTSGFHPEDRGFNSLPQYKSKGMKPKQSDSGFFMLFRPFARKIVFDFEKLEVRIYKDKTAVYKNGEKLID